LQSNVCVSRAFRASVLFAALIASLPASAQQKTGPGITGDDSLTWHGITLYGVIDIDVQYDTHGPMYSGVHDGAASGHFHSTNINPTLGVRYKF
jgi:hypothetical protein